MVKKKLTGVLALLLTLMFLLSACTSSNAPTSSAASEGDNSTASESSSTEKAKLTMFHHTGGTGSIPDKFDYKNNDIINKIAELANVEFTEVTVPAYADLKTKFNLMMSSGSIPDIVIHNTIADMNQYGKDGAFLELSEIVANSAVLSEKYNEAMLEASKADDGNLYLLRSLPTEDGWHLLVRNDMLKAAGVTTIPSTLDEWVEAMKQVKQEFPDAIMYTSMGMTNYMQFLFKPFGCDNGWGWQYIDGKVANVFENPNLEKAVTFAQELLAEGLLDQEFATTTQQTYTDKRRNNNVLLVSASLASVPGSIDLLSMNNVQHVEFIPVQWPFEDPESLDPYQMYVPKKVVGNQGIAISSQTQSPDAAARVIEAFLSDEVLDLVTNGREGIEYTVENGEKVFDATAYSDSNWRNVYGVMFSYNPLDKIKVKGELSIAAMKETDEFKEAYKAEYEKAFDDLYNAEYGKIGYAPVAVAGTTMETLIPLSSEANSKTKEAIAEQQSILLKAIMGEISMDEFDQQRQSLVEKYQSITDEFNEKLPECKEKYGIE